MPPSPFMPRSARICSTSAFCSDVAGFATSRTCTITSAAVTSSRVARKAAMSCVGRSEMKPTVSDMIALSTPGKWMARMVGSSVAKSRSSAITVAPVKRLNSVDFPAFVYPTSATTGHGARCRRSRCNPRVRRTCSSSRRKRAMRLRMRRRSASIWVSPGPPRKPKPPRWRSR